MASVITTGNICTVSPLSVVNTIILSVISTRCGTPIAAVSSIEETFSIKADKDTKMGLISDIKQELRNSGAYKIFYNAAHGERK